MKPVYLPPRFSQLWMMLALLMIMLPHVPRMPVWVVMLATSCLVYRYCILRGLVSAPGQILKAVTVVSVTAGIAFQYGRSLLTPEAMIAMLISGIVLKLLEIRHERDLVLVIFLTYFTSVAEFIFSQTIPVALYIFTAVLINTCALLSMHQQVEQEAGRTLKFSFRLMLQSVPLMLALFVLFPRMSPLWSMPTPERNAATGISNMMQPGDIGRLIRSPDVAFKVQFDGNIPENGQLYWRGLTLDQFNGRGWIGRRNSFDHLNQDLNDRSEMQDWYQDIEWTGEPLTYEIIMEPSYQNWMFALKMPQVEADNVFMNRYYQVESRTEISQRKKYRVSSWPDYTLPSELDPEMRRRSLLLPNQGNESSHEFAESLYAEYGNDQDYLNAVLSHFRQEEFFYTLEPAGLGRNSIDDFLFETREGFCEHYASTFTFLMRAAGIPARVVTGYLGGERNPFDDTLIVHQYDAHAWSEVWLDGQGWVRVDPTAAVAPQRITLGSELTYQEEAGFLGDAGLAGLFMRSNLFWNQVRLYRETVDYYWIRFVLNYDQGTQFDFFSRFMNSVSQLKIALYTLAFILVSMGLLMTWILWPANRHRSQPAVRLYMKFCRKMKERGFERQCGEVPEAFCRRIISESPGNEDKYRLITRLYNDLMYRPQDTHSALEHNHLLGVLKKTVRSL